MDAFLGCCMIAGAVVYVGRKIARVLFGLLVVVEEDAIRRKAHDERRQSSESSFR